VLAPIFRSRADRPILRVSFLAAAFTVLALCVPGLAIGCDVCAIYSATEHRESRTGWLLGVGEQYSRFATLKDGGEEIENPGERLHSSITQLLFGYNMTSRFGVQLNVPIITRDYRRLEDGVLTNGDESGVGDLSLLGIVRPYSVATEHSVFRFSLLGGLKLPSGSPDRLREELAEDHGEDQDEVRIDPGDESHEGHEHSETSGVHGHDLALGSGSVDGVIGGQLFASWRQLFLTAGVQYAIRTEGRFDYRYANDLTWNGGPGVFAAATQEYTLALQAVVSGEHKGEDELDGKELGDSAITAVYLGPGITFTWTDALGIDVTADLPILQDNSGVQLVPDFRLRGGVTWHF
jgi:hypothetical protein